VVEATLVAGTPQAAWSPVREELEVLDRDSLLSVAIALTVEAALILPVRGDRARLLDRVQRRRLTVMVDG
jgi:hypothetical protein